MDLPIYSDDWKAWSDPHVPEFLCPTELLLDRHLDDATRDKVALIVDDRPTTYAELHRLVCRVANGLRGLGIPAEARILLSATDSLAFVATWLGTVRAGMVPAGISDLYKPDQLSYFIRDTAAKVLFIDAQQLPKLREIRHLLPETLRMVIVHGAEPGMDETIGDTAVLVAFDDLVHGQSPEAVSTPRHANDISYMFYSGGTTGTPKGITHLAHDFILVPERHGFWWEFSREDVVYATSKKYFTHGLWPGVLIPLYHGATAILSSAAPLPPKVIANVERHRPSKLITVPTIIKQVLAHCEEAGMAPDFSSLRAAYSASEKMPPEMFEHWHDRFGIELMDSIGSSEVTYEWIANRPSDFRRGSLGRPVPGVEIRLVDDKGEIIENPNTPGECLVKSRTACLFYWRKLDQTKATFQGEWVRTGDQLIFDSDGFFWFAGRTNDIFKVKGLWVSPLEIEAVITRDHRVLEAAAAGVDGPDGLTQVSAFVVLRPGAKPDSTLAADLKERVRNELGGYKTPRHIEFVEELPRTPLQKIDRQSLRNRNGYSQE